MRNNRLRNIYNFYTDDLSYDELRKLINKEAPSVLKFYLSETKQPDKHTNPLVRYFVFGKNLFLAFLFKLNPLRRLIYSILLFIFIWGFLNSLWYWVSFSFVGINLLLAFEVAEKLTAKGELELAKNIQEGLIPKNPPDIPSLDISFYAETAKDVGGDYLDFIPNCNSDKYFMFIGDISGKGMAAALYMIQVRALIHHIIQSESDLIHILTKLNNVLCEIFSKNYFFTVNAAILENNNITFCRAGHLPALCFSKENNSCSRLTPPGIGLGLTDSDLFQSTLQTESLTLKSGDILIFFSDGVTETMNTLNQEFGDTKLEKIILANSHKKASEIKNAILVNLNAFRGYPDPDDDISIVVIKAP